jgi:monothiol glutaredoxin
MAYSEKVIDQIVKEHNVVLFMKGTAQFPMCGFSGKAIQLLNECNSDFDVFTVNVLDNNDIRQGIKEYSNWPTIPQLYVNGEFVGGSDILIEMHGSGELQQLLKTKEL